MKIATTGNAGEANGPSALTRSRAHSANTRPRQPLNRRSIGMADPRWRYLRAHERVIQSISRPIHPGCPFAGPYHSGSGIVAGAVLLLRHWLRYPDRPGVLGLAVGGRHAQGRRHRHERVLRAEAGQLTLARAGRRD